MVTETVVEAESSASIRAAAVDVTETIADADARRYGTAFAWAVTEATTEEAME